MTNCLTLTNNIQRTLMIANNYTWANSVQIVEIFCFITQANQLKQKTPKSCNNSVKQKKTFLLYMTHLHKDEMTGDMNFYKNKNITDMWIIIDKHISLDKQI